jgi:hypothetical protein
MTAIMVDLLDVPRGSSMVSDEGSRVTNGDEVISGIDEIA